MPSHLHYKLYKLLERGNISIFLGTVVRIQVFCLHLLIECEINAFFGHHSLEFWSLYLAYPPGSLVAVLPDFNFFISPSFCTYWLQQTAFWSLVTNLGTYIKSLSSDMWSNNGFQHCQLPHILLFLELVIISRSTL